MVELMSRIQSNDLIAIVGILAGCLCAIAVTAATVWSRVRTAQISAALKQDMLDRGMSADEIQAVLEAGAKH
jgi:hypothetical protein